MARFMRMQKTCSSLSAAPRMIIPPSQESHKRGASMERVPWNTLIVAMGFPFLSYVRFRYGQCDRDTNRTAKRGEERDRNLTGGCQEAAAARGYPFNPVVMTDWSQSCLLSREVGLDQDNTSN